MRILVDHGKRVFLGIMVWLLGGYCCGFASAAVDRVAPKATATPIQGRLQLQVDSGLTLEVFRDDYQFAVDPALKVNQLPQFNVDFVQDGNLLIPVQRGSIPGAHPLWEFILEPGRIRVEYDAGATNHISLPFTLQERNANCMHNGTLDFSLRDSEIVEPVRVEIASETCQYFKYRLSGSLAARFAARKVPGATALVEASRRQRAARLPVQPLSSLMSRYPGISLPAFAGAGKLPAEDNTVYGFVLDGVHYRSDCRTRGAAYRFCDDINLPSYSLAKSLIAGLAAMRLEKLYPGSLQRLVAELVPACRRAGNWGDVTLDHTLNMMTGNFGSSVELADEASASTDSGFFQQSDHQQKIEFSCTAWPRSAEPGSQWVYHTTDTYILGVAMTALLREQRGPAADIYNDLVLPLWQDLNLSPASRVIRRSYDVAAQPFTGYGMTLIADDIARLAVALNRGLFADQLDAAMYNSALQRLPEPSGIYPVDGNYYYSNGFWGYEARSLPGCEQPVVIPFMSGYGGINVVMMPNDTIFYTFNDGGSFAFADVLLQSHRIRSLCPGSGEGSPNPTRSKAEE